MNEQDSASISVRVNVANPGQFFACCGLLEIADKVVTDGAEGWFDTDVFYLRVSKTLPELLYTLIEYDTHAPKQLACGLQVEPAIAPLELLLDSTKLILDAWTRIGIDKGITRVLADSSWKFWSGNQSCQKIWSSLQKALQQQAQNNDFDKSDELFSKRCFLEGRFGFDAQAAWNALDVGYSPHAQEIPVSTSPAMEMLALVGLQRFRPRMVDRFTFEYATWGVRLHPAVAQGASSGSIHVPPSAHYRGTIIRRGKYGGLAYSTKL